MSENPKRRWYQFSLRGLFGLMTLVCAYFASWEATSTIGIPKVLQVVRDAPLREEDGAWRYPPWDVTTPMPFVVGTTQWLQYRGKFCFVRRHYVWFFGLTFDTHTDWMHTGSVTPYPTLIPTTKVVILPLPPQDLPQRDYDTPPPALQSALETDRPKESRSKP